MPLKEIPARLWPRMSSSLTPKGRLAAICMLVGALITIGLALSGVLQSGSRSPVGQVAAK
jgi:hypothetical protein